jgi:hypothetical protein
MQITPSTGFREQVQSAISAGKKEVARMIKILDSLEDLLHGSNGQAASSTASPTPKARKTKKRTPEEVTEQAKNMLAFIKKAGDEGVSGKQINAKFGKVVGTTKAFIESRTGEKLKTKGQKSAMRYFAV